jgi:hypothetical protein
VRQTQAAANASSVPGEEASEAFKEFVLLDSAGRLQVPREYLEQFKIQVRVHLEIVEEGILIRPAAETDSNDRPGTRVEEISPETDQAERPGLRNWWKRLRDGGRKLP